MTRTALCRFHLFTVSLAVSVASSTVLLAADDKVSGTKALPDVVHLLTEVRHNQANIERLQKDYICTYTQTEIETDGNGKEKKREVEQRELFFIAGRPVTRLVAKDGKALSEPEKQKEEKKVQEHIRKLEDRAKKEAEKDGEGDDERGLTLLTILKMARFVNPRWETYRGQSVVAADFEPNPEAKPKGRWEDVAHKLSGSFWVDEQALEVVKAEVKLDEGLKVAGGLLASIKEGSMMILEQQRINNEIWMPASTELRYNARIVFAGKHGTVTQQFGDYRKFRATTEIKGFTEVPEVGTTKQ